MRRTLVFILCLLVWAAFFTLLPQAAQAEGWEWRQDDWSGGPGQMVWLDDARYAESVFMDTMSIPGTMRISHVDTPYAKDPTNPVLDRGGPGSFDSQIVYGTPVPRDDGGYFTLYTAQDSTLVDSIGLATSPDGTTWSKHPGNPVLRGSGAAWEPAGIQCGPMLRQGDTYHLWFIGTSMVSEYYGHAVSTDLVSWTRQPGFVFGPGAPGAWDEAVYGAQIIRDGNLFKMWYLGTRAGTTHVGCATSPDGVNWTRSSSNPVLRAGAAPSWDDIRIESFRVLKRPWKDDYLMLYSAQGSTAIGIAVGAATSPDGINWTKASGNPAITPGPVPSWNDNAMEVRSLSFDGSMHKADIWGTGFAGGLSSGEAWSLDGTVWPATNDTISVGGAGSWDFGRAGIMSSYYDGASTRGFYHGEDGMGRGAVGTAVSMPAYSSAAILVSSVFDAGSAAQWGEVTWDEAVPAGCGVAVSVRTGDTSTPDATWSTWAPVANGGTVPGAPTRFIQYMVQLNGTGTATPVVSNVAIDLYGIPTDWFFAEGYTGPGFDEWITIQNPDAAPADVLVSYFTLSGTPVDRMHSVPGNSRYTIYVNTDLGENQENSFRVSSSRKVIVERPMYFRYSGMGGHDWRGGHNTLGSTGLSRRWYFAEGYTGTGFEEWITVQNPNPAWATVDVTYFVKGGGPIRRQHRVGPTSRYTIMVNQDAGPGLEISAMLQADRPILAERPMYFDFMGRMDGGHIVVGSPHLSQDWYLAEGATFSPFTEYITVQNPNAAPATVAVAYYTPGGAPITRTHTIPANSRYTINAGMDAGVASDLSAYLHSNLPVLVERPMYFDMLSGGLPGGHCAMGVTSPSTQWYFAEGYTGPGFDEWLTVQNPGTTAANLVITYNVKGGTPKTSNHTVQPQARFTINVGSDAGKDLELSAFVLSDQPVICERPMYFFYQGYHSYNWPGGHDSQGFAP